MTTERLRIGFLPLVDAALPILAHELGFAEAEGLSLDLVRDVTWATVRDRLLYGHTDMGHMVAPLAIATALGRDRPATARRCGNSRQRDARSAKGCASASSIAIPVTTICCATGWPGSASAPTTTSRS